MDIFTFAPAFSEPSTGVMEQLGTSGFMELEPTTEFSRRRRSRGSRKGGRTCRRMFGKTFCKTPGGKFHKVSGAR